MRYHEMPFEKLRPFLEDEMARNAITSREASRIVEGLMYSAPADSPLHRRCRDYLQLLKQRDEHTRQSDRPAGVAMTPLSTTQSGNA